MKHTQRLDLSRLAAALGERSLVEQDTLEGLLATAQTGEQPFCEALVQANLMTDWDLGRLVSEVFQLPFLPVEQAKPNEDLLEAFDCSFLEEHGLVPVHRFGEVVTVAMPGLVQAETLAMLSMQTDFTILPIVGTVQGNRSWLNSHLKLDMAADTTWGHLFDEGDANVHKALQPETEEAPDLESAFPALPSAESQAKPGVAAELLEEETSSVLPPPPSFEG